MSKSPRPARAGVEVITRRVTRPLSERDPELERLNQALGDVAALDVDAYIRTVFSVPGPERIGVFRILPNGSEANVGYVPRDLIETVDNFQEHLLERFGGPGTWLLKPAKPQKIGGYIYYGRQKRVAFGVSAASDAGFAEGSLEDVDRILAQRTKRLAVMEAGQQMKLALKSGEGGEDEMTPQALAALIQAIGTLQHKDDGAVQLLVTRLDRLETALREGQKPGIETLLAGLSPLFGSLLSRLSPPMIRVLMDRLFPRAEPATAEPGFWEGVRPLVQEALPLLRPMLEQALARSSAAPALPAASPSPSPSTEAPMVRWSDPEAVEYVVNGFRERRFEDVLVACRHLGDPTTPGTPAAWVAQIEPGVDPVAYWWGIKGLDARLGELKATVLEFIEFTQAAIERYLKELEAQTREGDEKVGGTTDE